MSYKFVCKKTGTTFDVPNYAEVPASAQQECWQAGVGRWLNDEHASIVRKNYSDDTTFRAAVDGAVAGLIARIKSGQVRTKTDSMEALVAKISRDPAAMARLKTLVNQTVKNAA